MWIGLNDSKTNLRPRMLPFIVSSVPFPFDSSLVEMVLDIQALSPPFLLWILAPWLAWEISCDSSWRLAWNRRKIGMASSANLWRLSKCSQFPRIEGIRSPVEDLSRNGKKEVSIFLAFNMEILGNVHQCAIQLISLNGINLFSNPNCCTTNSWIGIIVGDLQINNKVRKYPTLYTPPYIQSDIRDQHAHASLSQSRLKNSIHHCKKI